MLILGLVKLSQVSKYDWLGKNAQYDVLGYAIPYLFQKDANIPLYLLDLDLDLDLNLDKKVIYFWLL